MAADFAPLYQAAGERHNVDPRLLAAVAQVESSGNAATPDSEKGAQGLMQIMPATAASLGVANARDPSQAIFGAARLLSENLDRYGNADHAVLAYHGGTDERNWGPKTRAYLQKVTAAYAGKGAPGAAGEADDAFSAAFSGKAAKTDDGDPFSAAFGPKKAAPEVPISGAPAAPVAGTPDTRPTASASPPMEAPRAAPIGRMVEAFKASPLGPSDQFLDTIGLRADGPSGILRAPARGALTAGDAGVRVIGALMKTGADTAGDLAQTGAGLTNALGLTNVDPATVGNQLQRDAHGMLLNAGIMRSGVPAVPNRLAAAARTEEGAPALIGRSSEAPMPMAARAPEPAAVAAEAPGLAARAEVPGVPPEAAPAAPNPLTGMAQEAPPAAAAPRPAIPESPLAGLRPPKEVPTGDAAIPDKLPRKPLLPILTRKGANRQADKIIKHFAGEGPTELKANELVPGSTPTLAQATGNPGIATLERGFRDVNPNAFVQRAAANGDARAQALLNVSGTEADIAAAERARDVATSRAKDAAFAATQPVDPLPLLGKIKEVLGGPEGQRDAVAEALGRIYNKIAQVDPATKQVTLQTDPAQLYGIRKAINDAISPKAAGTAGDARMAAKELIDIRNALDDVIETGAPGFKRYIEQYSEASRPIDGMRYLQGMNLTDASGRITLGKLDTAIKGLEKQQKLPGARGADSVTPEQLDVLKFIREDLRREGNSALGKSLGSNTFQNLATNALTSGLGTPLVNMMGGVGGTALGGPVVGGALALGGYGVRKLASRSERLVQDALLNKLIDPNRGASALTGPRRPPPE